jgi:hypothetical protein
VNAHRPGDVLDLLLAHILERQFELVPHLVTHDPADADTTGFGQSFEPGGNIHPVAIGSRRGPGPQIIGGRDFRLADEVRYIQRQAAHQHGRIVTVGQLILFATETGDACSFLGG